MRLTELLGRLELPALYRQIGQEELPDDLCVLTGDCCEQAAGEAVCVLPAAKLADFLKLRGTQALCVFCAGPLPKGLDVPDGVNLVCFAQDEAAISLAAQRALQSFRRRDGSGPVHESLLDRLMEGRIPGDENATELLRALGLTPNRRFFLVVVSFLERMDEIPWDDASEQLSRCLHGAPVHIYLGDLVALCSLDGAESQASTYPLDELEAYLASQSAFAAVSNDARRPIAVRALYQQARAAMRFGLALHRGEGSKVFYYERYAYYHIVEYCADAYRSNMKTHNLVYLCHPALGKVLRYDREHGTDFAVILRKYLENNCNMSRTARDMFMHRNTMLTKLEILRELLGVPLSDPMIRERLQFSFHVVDYVEKFLQGRTF